MKKVFVAAGHSNMKPGVVGTDTNGTVWREAYMAMKLRDAVSKLLTLKGVEHSTDGPVGDNDDLRDSIRMARKCDGVRVEFHFNAPGEKSTGIEVLAADRDKPLAQSLAAAIHKVLGTPLRGDKGWKAEDSGQHHRLGFVREGGGMVCEVAFFSNPKEIDLVVNRFDALVKALADWFELQAKGTLTSKVNVVDQDAARHIAEPAEASRLGQPANQTPDPKPIPSENGAMVISATWLQTWATRLAAAVTSLLATVAALVADVRIWVVAHRTELLVLLAIAVSAAAWFEVLKLRKEMRS